MDTQSDVIVRVFETAGGPVSLSRKLSETGRKITSQAVSQWRRVPAERALEVEALTGISRHELRPDVYGPAPLQRGDADA
jgi:DNA-binding transcriptional regulator YdaS (Cro superfamily)